MPSIMPFIAHGDTIPIVDIKPKQEGVSSARQTVGTQIDGLLPFDKCAHVPITILGLDASTLPAPELVSKRNQQLDFLIAKFQNLVITFSGGDFGTIRYKGTATGVEFLNLNTPPTQPHSNPSK